MCGEALKTNSFSGRAAHEIYSNDASGGAVRHNPEDRGKAGAVCQESRQRLYPKADTNARCTDLSYSHYERKRYLEGTAWAFPKENRYAVGVGVRPAAAEAASVGV